MVTLFLIVFAVGAVFMAFGIYGIIRSSECWKRYMMTGCDHFRRKHYYYDDFAPYAFVGFVLTAVGLICATHFRCINEEKATKAKETYLTKYDTLVLAEEKAAWLATEVGVASSNEIAKLCEMMPKMSVEKKAKLTDMITKLKMKSGDKSVLAFSFASDNIREALRNAESFKVNGNEVLFLCVSRDEQEVEEEVDVPGEVVKDSIGRAAGIKYAQVNGKHVLFHKEKRKVKKHVDVAKTLECKIL